MNSSAFAENIWMPSARGLSKSWTVSSLWMKKEINARCVRIISPFRKESVRFEH